MKKEIVPFTISELIDLKKNNMLVVNSEYQRGAVWNVRQQQLLIDSILRGYPLPMIYLHRKERSVGKYSRDDFDVIDGQQRLNALYEYLEGGFSLLNPRSKTQQGKLPAFIEKQDCPWADRFYSDLDPEHKDILNDFKISVALIEIKDENEVRDLFIRLQGGQPLNSQETRDAWPGGFTDFILRAGGKPAVARYPGHPFFTEIMKMKPRSDRGKTRMLAAQLAMLFFERRKTGSWRLPDIGNQALNEYYYDNLSFDSASTDAEQFLGTLSLLKELFTQENVPKLRGHDAMHALLLADELNLNYSAGWKKHFGVALNQFMSRLVQAKKNNEDGKFDEYWMEYGQWTRTNSDRGENIGRRHRFYVKKLTAHLGDLSPKDPNRSFGDLLRRILFFEQEKRCAVCMEEVSYEDMEVHHIVPHHQGGSTNLTNGAIVHKKCHPKSAMEVEDFQEKWEKRKLFLAQEINNSTSSGADMVKGQDFEQDGVVIPHGTPALMEYLNGDQVYEGRFIDGVLMVDGMAYTSLSSAANAVAITKDGKKTNLNGWQYWKVKLPGENEWIVAKELRDRAEKSETHV